MRSNSKTKILTGLWLLFLVGAAYFANQMVSAPPPPPQALPPPPPEQVMAKNWNAILAHAAGPPHGLAKAPYTLVEFGDFQCPQCGKARPFIESACAAAPNQVNLLFVHRPFEHIHQWAMSAAEASEVAASFGKFWPMYDQLYQNAGNLEPVFYTDYAQHIGIKKADFQKLIDSHKFQATVRADSDFCDQIGIQVTPTVAIRNNATGKILSARGAPDIQKLLSSPPWAGAVKTAGTTKL